MEMSGVNSRMGSKHHSGAWHLRASPGMTSTIVVRLMRPVARRLAMRFGLLAGMSRWRVALGPFGALQPALGHLVPGCAALRVVGEGSHVLAFGGVAAEFLGRNHPEKPPI